MNTQHSVLAPIRRLWCSGMTVLNILRVVVLILLVQSCLASSSHHQNMMRFNHPKRELFDRINRNGPYVGIVMAFAPEKLALESSGFFIPNSHNPSVDLSGRKFNIESIKGTKVIYVMSGERRLNAGITVQILLDVFDIRGIVHYRTAGSANSSLSFGDVSIPEYVAFTGAWTWKNSETKDVHGIKEMKIGNYNLPEEGENLLRKIEFRREEFLSIRQPMKILFWLENATSCLPRVPKVEYGLRGASADMFLNNAAYRKFLFKEFQVSTVDEESSAVVMTAMSNGVPSIVLRGVSDLAGGAGNKISKSLKKLAAGNSCNAAVKFIELIGASSNTLVMK
ncbi:hypothetical protein MKW92_042339 [Papaver armeniacum]|nr:hypothetical protein MKW92_042339 [Papaver armeniacum]